MAFSEYANEAVIWFLSGRAHLPKWFIAMHKRELGPVLVRKIIAQAGLTAEEFLKHV